MSFKNFEIERKWIIDKNKIPFSLKNFNFKKINQCYISKNPTIRIRHIDNNYILTFKKDINNNKIKRYEYEINLTKKEYYNLTKLSISNVISKKRYIIPYKNNHILLDVFLGNLNGIIFAEVEFNSIKVAKKFIPPKWFGKDVTNSNKYTNLKLAFKK